MKINWKLRLQNKVTLTSLVLLIVTFIYQLLSILGITSTVSEDTVTQLVLLLVDVLAAIGVVTDPTTKGLSDSEQALDYTEPKED